MTKQNLVQQWLDDFRGQVATDYERRFHAFEKFTGKTGEQLLKEARRDRDDPQNMNNIARLLYQFGEAMLDGKVSRLARGTDKGGVVLKNVVLEGESYSQKSVRTILGSIKSFFSYYGINVQMKGFYRKDVRLRNPQTKTRKYLFTKDELSRMLSAASLRDKAIIVLGLAGMDESGVSQLRVEEIKPSLEKATSDKVTVIELTRKKTNMPLGLVLIPKAREIIQMYIGDRKEGWLFPGYGTEAIQPKTCNRVLQALARVVGVNPNGRRLSFHCLRGWFSTSLKNIISDDLIDFAVGHAVAYDSAYVLEAQRKFSSSQVLEALSWEPTVDNTVVIRQEVRIKELEMQVASLFTDLSLIKKLPLYDDSKV